MASSVPAEVTDGPPPQFSDLVARDHERASNERRDGHGDSVARSQRSQQRLGAWWRRTLSCLLAYPLRLRDTDRQLKRLLRERIKAHPGHLVQEQQRFRESWLAAVAEGRDTESSSHPDLSMTVSEDVREQWRRLVLLEVIRTDLQAVGGEESLGNRSRWRLAQYDLILIKGIIRLEIAQKLEEQLDVKLDALARSFITTRSKVRDAKDPELHADDPRISFDGICFELVEHDGYKADLRQDYKLQCKKLDLTGRAADYFCMLMADADRLGMDMKKKGMLPERFYNSRLFDNRSHSSKEVEETVQGILQRTNDDVYGKKEVAYKQMNCAEKEWKELDDICTSFASLKAITHQFSEAIDDARKLLPKTLVTQGRRNTWILDSIPLSDHQRLWMEELASDITNLDDLLKEMRSRKETLLGHLNVLAHINLHQEVLTYIEEKETKHQELRTDHQSWVAKLQSSDTPLACTAPIRGVLPHDQSFTPVVQRIEGHFLPVTLPITTTV
ncbi:uncharacterized protein LOC135820196 isoform X2 [Sycon ciliatum]|uniref:uncharacterized protein LOC135820196 isoform X2 n=1 Tax=Sycon ciliatum TaxID=27933 RepID=UPI0031F62EEA